MEDILVNIAKIFVFINESLTVTEETKEEHEEKIRKIFGNIDGIKLQLKKKNFKKRETK